MKILAIETSCDETAAAVVEDGREILSSVVSSQIDIHKIYGGVVPEIASRKHIEVIVDVTENALENASLDLNRIDAIAVTYAPGLIGSLLVGVNFAKGLSYAKGLPLVPVHHLRSHIASNYPAHKDLSPPFICLIVSGGHSHIVEVIDYTDIRIVGKTHDDAAGEVFDKAARAMGLPYPGGVHLDKMSQTGKESAFTLPRPHIKDCKYDFSFSGLKTAIINIIHNLDQKNLPLSIEDLCASFQNAVVDCLVTNFIAAATDLKYKKLVIAGGVSANSCLRKRLKQECANKNFELYMPPLSLCGDNAAMVGSQGYYEYLSGNIASLDLNAYPTRDIRL
jgi:N6-L-threonylcarbamoyladenine synthase